MCRGLRRCHGFEPKSDLAAKHLRPINFQPAIRSLGNQFYVGGHHFTHQLSKTNLVLPTKLGARLRRVSQKRLDLRRPEIAWIYAHQGAISLFADSEFFYAGALPLNSNADFCKGQFDKFTHGVGFSSCKNIIIGLLLLQNKPHPLGIITRMSPIPLSIYVAEIETVLFA